MIILYIFGAVLGLIIGIVVAIIIMVTKDKDTFNLNNQNK
jgi:NhaP-type Na+/H+ or K+/H+ antiporter